MIDYTILAAFMPFANIMQLQGSWVGFLQKRVMSCVGCVWFQRGEVRCSQMEWPVRKFVSLAIAACFGRRRLSL